MKKTSIVLGIVVGLLGLSGSLWACDFTCVRTGPLCWECDYVPGANADCEQVSECHCIDVQCYPFAAVEAQSQAELPEFLRAPSPPVSAVDSRCVTPTFATPAAPASPNAG
jgi:hypothetical protein